MQNNLRLSILLGITSYLSPIYSASKTVEDYVNEIVTQDRLQLKSYTLGYTISNIDFGKKFPKLDDYLTDILPDEENRKVDDIIEKLKKTVSQQLKDQETHTFFNDKDKPMLPLIEFYARSSTFLTFLRAISGKKEQTMDKFISDYRKKMTKTNFDDTDFLLKRSRLKKVWENEGKLNKNISMLSTWLNAVKPLWESSESKTIRALFKASKKEEKTIFNAAKLLVEDLIASENLTAATFLERIAPLKLLDKEEEQGSENEKPFNLDWKTVSLGLVAVVVVIAATGYLSSKSKQRTKEEEI
ncbi:MAG: hypothetical protein AAF335_02505 [Bacteroidota bacterium]